MTLFLDCEFDGHMGKLISMALVSDTSSDYFYEFMELDSYTPWVKCNVVPNLQITCEPQLATSEAKFRKALCEYLIRHASEQIICDSPADIRYLCEYIMSLDESGFKQLNTTITFKYCPDIEYKSEVPHNAYYDAVGIMNSYLEGE